MENCKEKADNFNKKYMLREGEPEDMIKAMAGTSPGDRWFTRLPAPLYLSDTGVFTFTMTMRAHYDGQYAGPLFRLFLHATAFYGIIAGQQANPEMLMGLLADPAVRGKNNLLWTWAGPDGFFLKAVVTPLGHNRVPPRQNFAWHVGSPDNYYPTGTPERKHAVSLTGQLANRIKEAHLGKFTLSGDLWTGEDSRKGSRQVFRLRPGSKHRQTHQEIISPLMYFCDPFFGEAGMPLEAGNRTATEGWSTYLSGSYEHTYHTLGVLVSVSPAYAPLAKKIRLEVTSRNSHGDSLKCQVRLGMLARAAGCQMLPDGWAASVPFAAPFAIDGSGASGSEIRFRLLFDKEEAGAIRELEAKCTGEMRSPSDPEGDYLIVTPYLIGENYWESEK